MKFDLQDTVRGTDLAHNQDQRGATPRPATFAAHRRVVATPRDRQGGNTVLPVIKKNKMKTFLVTWPGTAQTVSEDQLETVCGLLTSSGLSHDVIEFDAAKPAAKPAAKKKSK